MARRSRMSMLKRQRELKKTEKAAHKRAKKHGMPEGMFIEPRATMGFGSEPAGEVEGEADVDSKSGADSVSENPDDAGVE